VTKKEIVLWLDAIDQLEKWYKGEQYLHYCPLCSVAVELMDCADASRCFTCLWVEFEGVHCEEYARSKFGRPATELRESRDAEWRIDSLARLKRWKKLLKSLPVKKE